MKSTYFYGPIAVSNKEKLESDFLLNKSSQALDRIYKKLDIDEATSEQKYGYDEKENKLYISLNRYSRGWFGQTTENTIAKIKKEFSQSIDQDFQEFLESITVLSEITQDWAFELVSKIEKVKNSFVIFQNRIGKSEKGEKIQPAAIEVTNKFNLMFNNASIYLIDKFKTSAELRKEKYLPSTIENRERQSENNASSENNPSKECSDNSELFQKNSLVVPNKNLDVNREDSTERKASTSYKPKEWELSEESFKKIMTQWAIWRKEREQKDKDVYLFKLTADKRHSQAAK